MATRSIEVHDVLGTAPESGLDWVREVERGLPPEVLDRLQAFGDLDESELDAVIPRRTRRHQRDRDRLTPAQSDRVARAARVFALAHRVFGDAVKANRWMKRPHGQLDGARPLEMLRTSAGAQMVTDLLGRIEHGVYG